MMGRSYVVLMENIAVTTLRTLLEITAPSNRLAELIEAWVTQTDSETSTQEEIEIIRKTVAGTGTAETPEPLSANSGAAGSTSLSNCTGEGTLGNRVWREGFNILSGWRYQPVPEARIWVPPSGIVGIRFAQAPEASINVTCGLVFAEHG